ncbi:hypothetical protein HYH03_002029 [Edaphochlamys debaryana]|uniref:Nucleotide-diphospho-sugar transferase domain-containing protein n=1 Tax=Edaphochlamys debaryana TaxID=47281 RepID=A0A835YCK0_9CHLO|nr:hypothetical protein HYH03_002029 [Edaphochlamys debaryana]|eukprot:KAG2500462.1 hypothetical protein HYH03_002029 [Edaphochlamys debaryana]
MARRVLLLLLSLTASLSGQTAGSGAVSCRNPAFCSTGKLQHYVGPVDSAEQANQAFSLTAWDKELIVFAETRLEQAVHTLDRYRRAGYGHIIPVLVDSEQCQAVVQLMASHGTSRPGLQGAAGNVSCGWYRTADEEGNRFPSGFEYFRHEVGTTAWWRKWFTVARAVSLGYNVMSVDADTLPLGDWYGMVKAPPASDYNMISQAESTEALNGGFTYIQNAAPDGPVAYLLYEGMHRVVRWAENASALVALSPNLIDEYGGVDQEDQTMLSDVLFSCLAGRPVYYFLLRTMGDDAAGWAKLGGREAWMEEVQGEALYKMDVTDAWVNPPLADLVWGDPYPPTQPPPREPGSGRLALQLRTGELRMPHAGGRWPKVYGGYLFAPAGPYTHAYRQAFRDLGVPLPPDPEDAEDEERARATKPERVLLTSVLIGGPLPDGRYSQLGSWLEHGWFLYGRLGHWHLHLNPPYTGGMGHVHAGLPPGLRLDQGKALALMHSGHHNWRLSARLSRSPARAFLATGGLNASDAAAALTRVVAYAKPAFVRAAQELARVAAALGAAVAWPAADCSSDWVLNPEYRNLSKPFRHSIPWVHINTHYTVSPFGKSLDHLKCEWTGFAQRGCLASSRGEIRPYGILAVELDHLVERHRRWAAGAQGPGPAGLRHEYTLRLQASAPGAAAPPPRSTDFQPVSYDDLVSLNADVIKLTAEVRMPYQWGAVLWLDRLVEVAGVLPPSVAEQVARLSADCPGLSATVQASLGALGALRLRAPGAALPLLLLLGAALTLPAASATAGAPVQDPVSSVRLQPREHAPALSGGGLALAPGPAHAMAEDKVFRSRRLLNGNVQVDVSPNQPPSPQAASAGTAAPGVSVSLEHATVDVDSKSGSGCVNIPGIGRVGWGGGCR